MSRFSRLAVAVERAIESERPVLLFSAWQPADSLPAAVATLLLTLAHRLARLPLNPVLTYAPFTRQDDIAMERSVRVSRVVASRQRAKVLRWQSGTQQPRDFEQSDWEIAAQVLASADASRKLSLASFVAPDRINAAGLCEAVARPVLGKHAKNGPRLPQLRVLPVRSRSDAAIASLSRGDLVLIGLTGARGEKTTELTSAVLSSMTPDQAAVVLVAGAAELLRYSAAAVFSHFGSAFGLGPAPSIARLDIRMTGQVRAQHEKLFRYAIPSGDLSPEESELIDLAFRVWRQQWRTVDATTGASPIRAKFRQLFEDFRRRNPIAADRYNMLLQALHASESDAAAAASERLDRVVEAARRAVDSGCSRVLVVVGGTSEEAILAHPLATMRPRNVSVALSRHLAAMRLRAESVVIGGFYGPATLDGVLQVRPSHVTWIADPIEATQAANELRHQSVLLHQLGLRDMADLLGGIDSALRRATAGTQAKASGSHEHFVDQISFQSRSSRDDRGEDHGSREEEIDVDADYLVVLANGTRLRLNANRRFDVLRSQSPHPKSVRACDLQEGDQVLIVRNTYQQTLSKLLLEQMDTTVLRNEAEERRNWVMVANLAMQTSGLSAGEVAKRMRSQGIEVTKQTVQAWLRGDQEETTPHNWVKFFTFARTVGLTISEGQLRHYFDSIRRWRVGHQRRGRDVVRAVRAAYFGGLSVADMARIESDWGFGVRDLIEGCRVEEVESTMSLEDRTRA